MACPLPADQLKNFRLFIDLCKQDSNILHHPELAFFRNFILSLGGIIPPKKTNSSGDKPKSEPAQETAEPAVEEEDSAESDVELNYDGVIEPDNDPPQTMAYADQKVTEEDEAKSDERKRSAIELYSQQKYDDAVNAYTEAILLNPNSALLYAKRGQCYLQLKKPNACIRDCTRALEINPDSAAAYKFRGRAHRLLGNFLKAAEDLRNACKIDYDEQADEWLKEVTPNARKLEEHQRKYERKRLEKEVKQTRERIRKMREEQQKRAAETKEDSDDEGLAGAEGGKGDFLKFLKDPEVLQAFQDPEVAAAIQEMTRDPSKILNYNNNPKISSLFQKVSSKFKGKVPGFGGFPPFEGAADKKDTKPTPSADIDLD